MITADFSDLSIRKQCEVLMIPRSSYYYVSKVDVNEEFTVMNLIHELWLAHPFYGYRKITAALRLEGYAVNHKKIQRLMQKMDLQAIYPKAKTSTASKEYQKYPYLLKGLVIVKINQVWVTDITYIRLPDGFVYLLAIMDLHSRYIVASILSISMEAEAFIEPLEEAISKYGAPEIFNTDQGSQFTSAQWLNILLKNCIRISMDGKGRCFDNIFAERFWRTVKYEEVYLNSYETVPQARYAIMNFIEFYNNKRPHQALGYKTPKQVYYGGIKNSSNKKII